MRSFQTAFVVAALMAPTTAPSQGVTVSAVSVSAHHELLGAALLGGGVALTLPRWDSRLALRLGVEHLTGNAERFDRACAGLIEPGTCAPEPLRDRARLTSASSGLVLRVLGLGRASMSMAAELALADVRVDTRGTISGRALRTAKWMWGPKLGVAMQWTPAVRVPLALDLGAAAGRLTPVVHEQIADGYTPFENDFRVARLDLGVIWRVGHP